MEVSISFAFFLIFAGASIVASIALMTRQPLIVAYIVLGALLGPYGLSAIDDAHLLESIGEIGILFLLFLLGLDMQPKALMHVLAKVSFVTVASSIIFAFVGYFAGLLLGFNHVESLIVGAASTCSSTIIGIKLLPTTVLHHRHRGEMLVGILLVQDLVAILTLVLVSDGLANFEVLRLAGTLSVLPLLIVISVLAVRYLILPLFTKFDRFHEYVFLLSIGWCLGIAELANVMGLSPEIGAFIAGISLATSPISQYIAENLKPLRDFFLILFFFSLGAALNLPMLPAIILPGLLFTAVILAVKLSVLYGLLRVTGEKPGSSLEISCRLGQISEFSLLIVFVAESQGVLGTEASLLLQFSAIVLFMVSSYIVVFNFPSPIAMKDSLRRD